MSSGRISVGVATPGRSDVAIRRGEDETRDEVAFVGPVGSRVFTCIHQPEGQPLGGVVICSPLYSEHVANYRREVVFGRLLARMGLATIRFHYRGTGHSDGASRSVRIETMSFDATTALNHLRAVASIDDVAFVGTRLGAFQAATLAASCGSAPVVLWEPVVDGSSHCRELSRVRRMNLTTSADQDGDSDAIDSADFIEVLGYEVGRELLDSLTGQSLLDLVHDGSRILLVQMHTETSLRPAYRDLVGRFDEKGVSTESRTVIARPTWWFSGVQWFDEASTRATDHVIRESAEWIQAALR